MIELDSESNVDCFDDVGDDDNEVGDDDDGDGDDGDDDDGDGDVNNEMGICVLSSRNCWLSMGTDQSPHHFFTIMMKMIMMKMIMMKMIMMKMMMMKMMELMSKMMMKSATQTQRC